MITPSFSLTATERVLPKLALDFTTANLDSRVTFTRTTDATHPATYTNSSGIVVSATNNQPRFDYNAVTLACKGLLIEEARQNIFLYSDDQQNGWVGRTNSVITSDQATAPDNSNNGDLLSANSTVTSSARDVRTSISATVSSANSLSIFAKAVNGSYILMTIRNQANAANSCQAEFNISTGAISVAASNSGTATGATASITSYGNGWYRCSISGIADTSGTALTCIVTGRTTSGSNAVTADTQLCYLWGTQLELGAFPTSYIPTTSAALTRNADVATMTGTNFSSWYNASEGAIVCKADRIYTGNYPTYVYPFNINDNTTSNEITVYGASGSVQTAIAMATGGVNQLDYAFANWTTDPSTMGLAYKQNSTQYAFNSSAKTTDTSCSIPTVTQMAIGRRTTLGYWNGHIQKISYWPQRLTGAELAAFTK